MTATCRHDQSLVALTTEVRDIVEGLHGRPKRKRGVQVVLAEVICRDNQPHWVAKVKNGGAVIAKTSQAYWDPLTALEALLIATKAALGVRE